MTHALPCDSPGTLLCHQDMEERFISHFNEIFKERILPINNHELECLCVSLWLTFLPCQAGPAVSSVKEKNKTSMLTEDAGHWEWRELAHTNKGESPSCLPLLQTAVYFIDFIYWVGQKFQLGFAIPSYGKTWMNFSFFFFLIDKRWIYLQRDTLHRQSMGRAEGKSDLGGNTLHRSTGRCRKQQRPRLNVRSA